MNSPVPRRWWWPVMDYVGFRPFDEVVHCATIVPIPSAVSGKGPAMSTATLSIRSPTWYSCQVTPLEALLRTAHLTCTAQLFHSLFSVFLTPRCTLVILLCISSKMTCSDLIGSTAHQYSAEGHHRKSDSAATFRCPVAERPTEPNKFCLPHWSR